MKKVLTLLTAFFFLHPLSGCQTPPSADPADIPAAASEILTEPPVLTVLCGESSAEALKGGYHWEITNEDGSRTATITDSAHPLQCRDFTPVLALMPSSLSRISPFTAYLQFETAPDSVSARCWGEEYWGASDTESEELSVDILCVETEDGSFTADLWLDLKDDGYIYEVTAEWNRAEQYSGKASYIFYAAPFDRDIHPIEGS